jgi:hypothetical protein
MGYGIHSGEFGAILARGEDCYLESQCIPDGISEKGQEEVYNLISLAPNVHAMGDEGYLP